MLFLRYDRELSFIKTHLFPLSKSSSETLCYKQFLSPNEISKCLILSEFGDVYANISKSIFFFKNLPLSLFYLHSSVTSCKKSEKSLEPFLRKLRQQPTNQPNIKVSDFGLILRPFGKYLEMQIFFQKSGSVTLLPLQSPNLMQKIRKILRAISEKTALSTNQLLPTTPISYDLADAGPKKQVEPKVPKHLKINSS